MGLPVWVVVGNPKLLIGYVHPQSNCSSSTTSAAFDLPDDTVQSNPTTQDLHKCLRFPASDIPKQARELYKIRTTTKGGVKVEMYIAVWRQNEPSCDEDGRDSQPEIMLRVDVEVAVSDGGRGMSPQRGDSVLITPQHTPGQANIEGSGMPSRLVKVPVEPDTLKPRSGSQGIGEVEERSQRMIRVYA
ncbi:hypothetical protein P152DRAFT_462526 [Eremomyces bilateralis CBS 781.70]|uniref:Uncharacterized protein n=1 Tax=Eremomyces bilateralis CBS 781.70 TaxID=1392243 RepID=A0A6G1FRC6_9PEZI|nr:uncharacterized protein P152DRAFT_462526 [Eremomyces bilateralis CBS 781.70]KAF1808395.1 hypothetical protein P152DRAFT_462526 [Eremomyces bilateralis CBS 781.70]